MRAVGCQGTSKWCPPEFKIDSRRGISSTAQAQRVNVVYPTQRVVRWKAENSRFLHTAFNASTSLAGASRGQTLTDVPARFRKQHARCVRTPKFPRHKPLGAHLLPRLLRPSRSGSKLLSTRSAPPVDWSQASQLAKRTVEFSDIRQRWRGISDHLR